MDERLDRIEQWLKQLAEQMQLELRAMEVRLGKIEARLEQMATKARKPRRLPRLRALDQLPTRSSN